ncbi:hypothetical protein [Halocatena pleomorpha]|uniref:Uncharacterized protein n=1 Tax=Halocatena pleomorpha TaxID=1785090 RepID=A0A3P3R7S6_9EURY|nr:hypothetical protein EIK79_12860 [Halocatena pleomorpha]
MQQVSSEYIRTQNFIREVRKGREQRAVAEFCEIPQSKTRSILKRAETNDGIPLGTDQWRLERATVEVVRRRLPRLLNKIPNRLEDQ